MMIADSPLAEERLGEIEERLRRATPGPWACKDRLGGGGCFVFSEETFHVVALGEDDDLAITVPLGRADAELIARAREDLSLLVAEVRRLRALRGAGGPLAA